MTYRIECYIYCPAEEDEIYATRTAAEEVRHELEFMQSENIYKIVKVD